LLQFQKQEFAIIKFSPTHNLKQTPPLEVAKTAISACALSKNIYQLTLMKTKCLNSKAPNANLIKKKKKKKAHPTQN
jgi:hypothetical protein